MRAYSRMLKGRSWVGWHIIVAFCTGEAVSYTHLKAVQMEAQVRECVRLLEHRITQGLTDAERDQFLRTAQRMSENLKE